MDKTIIEFLKLNLHKACLESFGIKKQFIELEFSNSRFEEIKFFIDCKVSTREPRTEYLVSALKDLDKDTFEVAYFLNANLKSVIDCDFDNEGNFRINFENDYNIIFDFNAADDANLSITFKEKENSKTYIAIDILSDGDIAMNSVVTANP